MNTPIPARLHLSFRVAAALALATLVGCSSSDTSAVGDEVPVAALVQDLAEDRDGHVVAVRFERELPNIAAPSVEASGGQTVVSVTPGDGKVLIRFDERVTPSHQLRFLGVEGVSPVWRAVTTSDPRRPQVGVLLATQDVSDNELGGDTIQVAFFGGPRVVESDAEDISNWRLRVAGLDLDLTGSTVSLNVPTQVAFVTLGPRANLHRNFQIAVDVTTVADVPLSNELVAGIATGDEDPPALNGATPVIQLLDPAMGGDELGVVVALDFDEPMSPVFGASVMNFDIVDHVQATVPTLVYRAALDPADPRRILLQCSRPVVPTYDRIEVDGVLDAHGNPFPPVIVDVAAGSTVQNAFDTITLETVQGLANDRLMASMVQAIDPDTAALPTTWTLEVDGNPVDLAAQTLSYDLASRTLTIDLDFDVVNGVGADLVSVAAVDVDGESFQEAAPTALASGDGSGPVALSVVQNRGVDPSGQSVDITFDEDVELVSSTDTNHYTFSTGIPISSLTRIQGNVVRAQLDGVAVPGDVTLALDAAITDPAGNATVSAATPLPVTSTDLVPPSVQLVNATAIAGLANDRVVVVFDDTLVAADAQDPLSWAIESPLGTPVQPTAYTITYDGPSRSVTFVITDPNVPSLLIGDDVGIAIHGVRDIAGNQVTATPVFGVVDGEGDDPALETAFRAFGQPEQVTVVFDEAMRNLTDLYDELSNPIGARFRVTDAVTSGVLAPVSAVESMWGHAVTLTFASPVAQNSTLDVYGARDLAGNAIFPVVGFVLEEESGAAPALQGMPALTAVEGTRNDTIEIVFDEPMHPWALTRSANYVVTNQGSGTPVDLESARIVFDGDRTVRIDLVNGGPTHALPSGGTYEVRFQDGSDYGLYTREGTPLVFDLTSAGLPVVGDVVQGPTGASGAFVDPADPNALYVVFDETVNPASAALAAEYSIGGQVAQSALLATDRTVHVAFAAPVTPGGFVDVTPLAAIDTASNAAAGTLSLAIGVDSDGPAIVSTAFQHREGLGGDTVTIVFDEDLDPAQAAHAPNYALSVGGTSVRVAFALYDSQTQTTTLMVDDLRDGTTLDISISGVGDVLGNVPVGPLTTSLVLTGDQTPPAFLSAFVNLAADPSGRRIDVRFTEDVTAIGVQHPTRWSTSDGRTITASELIAPDRAVVLLDAPMGASATLQVLDGVWDYAGNRADVLTIDPVE